ncbi:hypothetical protein [Cognataquiflexum aquatile]|uniref:hypothetical protein n=1 Tax=Cognataquiflexum aquatile TaxID=2249427 RepID=UPI000DEAB234|nr:hypothetical protein [Cognataquiflexum aquatile]
MKQRDLITEQISYTQAGTYLENIKDPDLLHIYKSCLGGTFKARKLKEFAKQKKFSGLMFWFCLEKGSLYLACEPKFDFEYEYNPDFSKNLKPEQDELIRPGKGPFGMDLIGLRGQAKPPCHESLIRDHKLPNHLSDNKIPKEAVNDFNILFEVHPVFELHQKFGHAYFENKDDLVRNFLNLDGLRNVRYYFGYDTKDYPYQIRVILAPVNGNGENIQFKKVGTKGELLQKSTPPPPNE